MPITYPVENKTVGGPSPALDALQKLGMKSPPNQPFRLTETPRATPPGEVPIQQHIIDSLKMAYGFGGDREGHGAPMNILRGPKLEQ